MNSKIADPNNHVPEVRPDDGWGDVEGYLTGPIVIEEVVEETPTTLPPAVLPPKRPKEIGANGVDGDSDEGLRIESNVQRRHADEPEVRLEVQEIDGSVVRLDPEIPAATQVPRQIKFHEKQQEDPGKREREGESREWGRAIRHPVRWVAGLTISIAGLIIASLAILPKINKANEVRPNEMQLVIDRDENPLEIEAINDMLTRQPEALQIYRKYASATVVDDFLPLLRQKETVESLVRTRPRKPTVPKDWAPTKDINWNVFQENGSAFGIIDGPLPDFSTFTAYLSLKNGQLYLDWKATTGYSSAEFSELEQGMGDASEIRATASPTGFYTAVFPEADYVSYQIFSPNRQSAIWVYTKRGGKADASMGPLLAKSDIIGGTVEPRKVTLRLSRGPNESQPNQWIVEEMLHKEWITP